MLLSHRKEALLIAGCFATYLLPGAVASVAAFPEHNAEAQSPRERIRLHDGWRFWRSETIPDNMTYDLRPDVDNGTFVLKDWVLPSGNDYINDASQHHEAPVEQPHIEVPYAEADFDDDDWDVVTVPHDWAIAGPFYTEEDPIIPGGMGRLPVQGVGWYRRKLQISAEDLKKSIFLEVDGAMSYPIVWLNGYLIGGWPYGYNSFQLDLTKFLTEGENQLAIRVENPTAESSRWYPGAGIYRNVWLKKLNPTHVSNWGTSILSRDVSSTSAVLDLEVKIESQVEDTQELWLKTEVFEKDSHTKGKKVAQFCAQKVTIEGNSNTVVRSSARVKSPRLWGPLPSQTPNLYVAVTRLFDGDTLVDSYETSFGIRDIEFKSDGFYINGERVLFQGANQHHDLGALGAAFNYRAAERQLEILREIGVNGIRMAHNPPATELLELTDRMGFLVVDEIFDVWEVGKIDADFHLIFDDWKEPDLRSFLRRDRNHPSVIMWSVGNEAMEQNNHDDEASERISTYLKNIVREEDMTRPMTASMNAAYPNETLPSVLDVISLNYQGEGIRWGEAYAHLPATRRRPPQYTPFHDAFPEKSIFGSEVAWSLSSRGTFTFPVTEEFSAPVNSSSGGDYDGLEISGYELYSADAGSSPDKVFWAQDNHPFVAGGFVWAGWDYLGEPYPWGEARSAYSGIVDLAGFKKDRFWLYQARWRPDVRMAHILPHWNWPERVGMVTPVHVFSSADEAELFVNGESQGVVHREELEYRFRWDDVVYEAGEVRVETYKNGEPWATETMMTTGEPSSIRLTVDRDSITGDGDDLAFITAEVVDEDGNVVPTADNNIVFSISGPGEIVATDNGYQADFTAFPSKERKAFHGLALAIVRAEPGSEGSFSVTAESEGLQDGNVQVSSK